MSSITSTGSESNDFNFLPNSMRFDIKYSSVLFDGKISAVGY